MCACIRVRFDVCMYTCDLSAKCRFSFVYGVFCVCCWYVRVLCTCFVCVSFVHVFSTCVFCVCVFYRVYAVFVFVVCFFCVRVL